MDPERLLAKFRKDIGRFCFEECNAYCCRKGYLVLTKKEVELIALEEKHNLEEKGLITTLNDGKFSLCIHNIACPCLKDNKCLIHHNKARPKICKEFPVYFDLSTKTVLIAKRCFAIQRGMFYPIGKILEKNKYSIIYADSFSKGTLDIDVFGETELFSIKLE